MKTVRIILSPEAEEVYKYLNQQAPTSKIESSILNAINKKVELIKFDVHYEDCIKKSRYRKIYN